MRAYQSLLRVAKIDTDARSRALAEALGAEAEALDAIRRHDAMVSAERRAADASPDALAAFGVFFLRARKQRERLEKAAALTADEVTAARDALAAAMTEQRKMERLIELAEERAAEAEAAKERATLDEAATIRYAQSGRSKSG